MIREIIQMGDVVVKNILSMENLVDPFTKMLTGKILIINYSSYKFSKLFIIPIED